MKKIIPILFIFCFVSVAQAAQKRFSGMLGTLTQVSSVNAQTVDVELGDMDGDGVKSVLESIPLNGSKKLFYLAHRPVHRILSVKLNGATVSASNYSYHLKNGWMTLKNVYSSSNTVSVSYEYSTDLDIVGQNGDTAGQQDVIYNNNNNFNFSGLPAASPTPFQARDADLGDFDNDGDLDILNATQNGSVSVFVNNGGGIGYTEWFTNDFNKSQAVSWGDVDGDGLLDFAVANGAGNKSKIFKNIGGSSFSEIWDTGVTASGKAVDFGDYDNDGDLDVAFADMNGRIKVYRNEKASPYTYVGRTTSIERRNPSDLSYVGNITTVQGNPATAGWNVASDENFLYVAWADSHIIGKYRKSDLGFVQSIGSFGVSGNSNNKFNRPYSLTVDDAYVYIADYLNNRVVKVDKNTMAYVSETVASTLYNGLSIMLPKGITVNGNNLVLSDAANNRILVISKSTFGYVASAGTFGTGVNQLNNPKGNYISGNDLFLCDYGNNRVKKYDFSTLLEVSSIGGVAAGSGLNEFNNNIFMSGNEEGIFIGDYSNSRIQKRSATDLSLITMYPMGFSPFCVYCDSNLGRTFTSKWTSPTDMPVSQVQWADVDNDGDLDLVVVNDNSVSTVKANVVYRNDGVDGSGNLLLTEMWVQPLITQSKRVAIGDIDKDGYLDLVFTNSGTRSIEYYQNNQTGGFTYKWGSNEDTINYNNFNARGIALGDFNKDGYPDMAVAADAIGSIIGGFQGTVVYRNNALGGKKVIKIKSTAGKNSQKASVTIFYRVKEDGTIGEAFTTNEK